MSIPHHPPADQGAREQIRHALGTTLLVEAAAGTGKTTELVRRIVNLVATGQSSISRLAVLTFTEKAASELKLRVRQRLDHERQRETDPARKTNLETGLKGLEEACINTLHAFCADLLRERSVEAGIDPGFEVLTEAAASRVHRTVFDDWFLRALEHPPQGLRRALSRRFEGEADEDEGPVGRLRRASADLVEWRDFPAPWRRDPAFDRQGDVERLRLRLRDFAQLTGHPGHRGDNLATDTAFIRAASEDLEDEARNGRADLDEQEARLVRLARHRDRSRMRKGSGALFAPGVSRASVLAERDAVLGEIDAFVEAADADLAAQLRHELAETVDRHEARKRGSGQLDFLDLLIRARDLLRDDPGVRAEFQDRFDSLLVDEFQDTDPIQAEILLLLAADDPLVNHWRDVRVTAGKLFIVADPKQSIYRFRRADVGIYEEVKCLLRAQGVEPLQLSTSFRAVPGIQRFVNRVFEPLMVPNPSALQAGYVALQPWRLDLSDQPSVVALPVPRPYGFRQVSGRAIEESLPDAVGAFVAWLLNESHWTVTERTSGSRSPERVPIAPHHVCLLFRRFSSWGRDVTRPYVLALEARDIPHLLVGGRSFHDREEVETIKAALSALEWPDHELSVFATLRGALFAFPDAVLLRWRESAGAFSPFRVPEAVPPDLTEVREALGVLKRLHARRNHVPVAHTIAALLEATRAHAALALRPNGEQALANVLHVAELARQYEMSGGISFRGFVEEFLEGRFGDETQAPILEEGGEGVRAMTLHKAKGLEFPVVVLCDITANLAGRRSDRHLEPASGLCAIKLAGCVAHEVLEHEPIELARDRAEGIRIAYVAATRARDLLVVPTVGDEPYDSAGDKWISSLNAGLYPAAERCRDAAGAPGCPMFKSRDSVLARPDGETALPRTVAPGLHRIGDPPRAGAGTPASGLVVAPEATGRATEADAGFGVVWWDPSVLDLDREPRLGLREIELISKDTDPAIVAADLSAYEAWASDHAAHIEAGSQPSIRVARATAWAPSIPELPEERDIQVIELPRESDRPTGPRFGSLVHAVLSLVPLDADGDLVVRVVEAQARLVGATAPERVGASKVVCSVLSHDLLVRARQAESRGICRRETPVSVVDADGTLVEGQVDLAFEEDDGWVVVDFKTDADLRSELDAYRRQVTIYVRALAIATGRPARGVLLRV
jgi:ATP-dependent exoDNAse (exonuclease V) beta subunit